MERIDPAKEQYTKSELAALLKVSLAAIPPMIRRHRLTVTGNGKARRFPRATAEALLALRTKGRSVRTCNYYLTALKGFLNWMVSDRRAGENPVAYLSAGDENVERRRDRRELEAEELRHLLDATRQSARSYRGLSGQDRFLLYATACGTGFRASSLASLTPESFDLTTDRPTVTLAARNVKNRKTKVQPIPADLAELLREHLAGRPAGERIWPGTWASGKRGADMLRLDLEAAGIPYAIDGPDGPLYADFHALRHTYLTLGGRAGIDLRTLQELAGHSDPKLTARYSHRRLYDLAGAVEKLPAFLPEPTPPASLAATGTEGNLPGQLSASFPPAFRTGENERQESVTIGQTSRGEQDRLETTQPLENPGVGNEGQRLVTIGEGVGDRTRTGDILIHSQVL